MSWKARGLYRELLDEFWSEGIIPADTAELADICGCPVDEFVALWPEIESSWEKVDGGYVNRKMDAQRTSSDATRVKRAENGRTGGIAKLANASNSQASASECLDHESTCHIEEQSRAEKSREEQRGASSAPALPASPAVVSLPLLKGKAHAVTHDDVAGYRKAYPAVDILLELHKIAEWLKANPDRASKTSTGCRQRIVRWLTSTQDRGGSRGNGPPGRPQESSGGKRMQRQGEAAVREMVSMKEAWEKEQQGGQYGAR